MLTSTAFSRGDHMLTRFCAAEYEFFQFKTPENEPSRSTAAYLRENPPQSLPSLTEGMFGYSLTRPVHNKDYYYDIFNTCAKFQCDIEGWHTESGPGVFEAALEFSEIREMADRASLFKYAPGPVCPLPCEANRWLPGTPSSP